MFLLIENQEGNANPTKSSVVSDDDSNKSSIIHGDSYFADQSSVTSTESWSISSFPSYTEELKQLYADVGSMELGSRVKANADFDTDHK